MSSVTYPNYPRDGRTTLVVLLLGNAVVHATTFLARPVVSYRVLALGGDETTVGVVVATGAILPVFAAVPMGRLCDRGRVPAIVLGGLALLLGSALGMSQIESLLWLAMVNTVYGVGQLAVMLGGQALVTGMSAPGRRDRNFGWFTAAASLGQMAGPLAAGWAMSLAGPGELLLATGYAFYVAVAVTALASVMFGGLLFVLRGSEAVAPSGRAGEKSGRGSALRMLTDRQLAVAMLVSGSVIAAVDLLTAYLPVLGTRYGLSPGFVGVLLSVRAGASFLSRIFIGVLVVRFGRLTVVLLRTGLAACGMAALITVGGALMLVLLMVLLGMTLGLGQPLTMTWVVQQAPKRLRATALALRVSGNRVAQSVVPAVAGALSAVAGVAAPFALAAGLLALAAGCVVPFVRMRPRQP